MQHIARILSDALTDTEAKTFEAFLADTAGVNFTAAKALVDLKLIEQCPTSLNFKLTELGSHVRDEQIMAKGRRKPLSEKSQTPRTTMKNHIGSSGHVGRHY